MTFASLTLSWWLFDPVLLQGPGGGEVGIGGVLATLGLIGLIVLALNIVATISVVTGRLAFIAKVLWLLAIWLLPPIGMILYFLLGRTRR